MLQRIKCVCCMLILLCIVGINLSHAKVDIDELMKSAVGVWSVSYTHLTLPTILLV